LASLEIGFAANSVLPDLTSIAQWILFFVGPLMTYLPFGILLDFFTQRLALRRLSFLFPCFALAVLGYHSARNFYMLSGSPLDFVFASLGTLFLVVSLTPKLWPLTHLIQNRIRNFSLAFSFLGFLFLVGFLAIDRSVQFSAPIGQNLDKPNIVVITLDTLRADVLPMYGGKGLETPNLDKLAAHSLVFDDMCAVSPITGPSHASIFTGVMPPTHGLRSNGPFNLSVNAETLASSLSRVGYATGAVISAYPIRGELGFARGFDVYDDRLPKMNYRRLMDLMPNAFVWLRPLSYLKLFIGRPVIQGDLVLERTQEFLAEVKGSFFLWAHFFDAHDPHVAHGEWKEKAHAMSSEAWPKAVGNDFSAESLLEYRGQIMEIDQYVGRLIAQLESVDPNLENTVIFLLSDHGQCFGEGGFDVTHKPSLFEATQHIPALLYLPNSKGARRTDFPVNQIDVMPTLCSLAGATIPAQVQGVDLSPIARMEQSTIARDLFQDGFYMEAFQVSLRGKVVQQAIKRSLAARSGNEAAAIDLTVKQNWLTDKDLRKQAIRGAKWKYIYTFNGDESLFDLSSINSLGQREFDSLHLSEPDVLKQQKTALQSILKRLPTPDMPTQALNSVEQNLLHELGY
jgi:arylsulfatase A-like enzyme